MLVTQCHTWHQGCSSMLTLMQSPYCWKWNGEGDLGRIRAGSRFPLKLIQGLVPKKQAHILKLWMLQHDIRDMWCKHDCNGL